MPRPSVIPLVLAIALTSSAGLAGAQVFTPQPYDLSAEFENDPPDANNLPFPGPGTPYRVLDSKAKVPTTGLGAVDESFRFGIPVNEWIVPYVYQDEAGYRTKSFIIPGITRFSAFFGDWQDRDGDMVVDVDPDAATNEWTGRNQTDEGGNVTSRMYGFVDPGYNPSLSSDWYILADWVFVSEDEYENQSDFEYIADDFLAGHWVSEDFIPFTDESILEEVHVHTVANPILTPGTAPGYTCTGAQNCSIDIDRYDLVAPEVLTLYGLAIDTVVEVLEMLPPIDCPPEQAETCDEAVGLVIDSLIDGLDAAINSYNYAINEGFNATYPPLPKENALTPAYFGVGAGQVCTSSMMGYPGCGAPRLLPGGLPDPDGYNYQKDWQAWADLVPNHYTSDGQVLTLASPVHGVPDESLKARGIGPALLGIQGKIGFWYDRNADGWIGNETADSTPAHDYETTEWAGTCDTVRTATGQKVGAINYTLEPVDAAGAPTTWGTTGAFLLRNEAPKEPDGYLLGLVSIGWYDEIVTDALDNGNLDRNYLTGPIPMQMTCDTVDTAAGDWFSRGVVLLPEGTRGFNIKMTMETGISVLFSTGLKAGQKQAVRDIDVYTQWD